MHTNLLALKLFSAVVSSQDLSIDTKFDQLKSHDTVPLSYRKRMLWMVSTYFPSKIPEIVGHRLVLVPDQHMQLLRTYLTDDPWRVYSPDKDHFQMIRASVL